MRIRAAAGLFFPVLALAALPLSAQRLSLPPTEAPEAPAPFEGAPLPPDPWIGLESAALSAAGVAAPSRAEEFRLEAARRLRSAPDASLADNLAAVLTNLHRLDADRAAIVQSVFDGRPVAKPLGVGLKRLIDDGDELLAASDDSLYRVTRPDRYEELSPIWKVRDVVDFGGRRYVAAGKGASLLDGKVARKIGIKDSGGELHDLAPIGGALFAAGKGGLYRIEGDGIRSIQGPAGGETFHLSEIGGRVLASTNRGVYAGKVVMRPETREILERLPEEPRPWYLFFLPKPPARFRSRDVSVQAAFIEWDPKPLFAQVLVPPDVEFWTGSMAEQWKVKAFQTCEIDGSLHVATSNGIYAADKQGWKNSLTGKTVHRLRVLASGTYAATDSGVFKKSAQGWERVFPEVGSAYDIAEKDGAVYVASEKLSAFRPLPERWEEAVLRSISAEAEAPPHSMERPSLRVEEGKIIGPSGRSILKAQ